MLKNNSCSPYFFDDVRKFEEFWRYFCRKAILNKIDVHIDVNCYDML